MGNINVEGPVTLVATPNAMPLSFSRKMSVNQQKVNIDCTFEKNQAQVKVSGAQNLERDVKLNPGDYCFDNNFMGAWILICSQLDLKKDASIELRTFHPSSLQFIPLTCKVTGTEKISVLGEELECFVCDIEPIKNKILGHQGRTIRKGKTRNFGRRTQRAQVTCIV